jgi:phytoene dehydrogenase-like protein
MSTNPDRWSPQRDSARRARQAIPEQVDVAVVGAGLGGLVAAARLARAGKRVAVFDGHYVAGGSCTMFQRRGPGGLYNFDIGLHYIGDCGVRGAIPSILGDLGITLDYRPLDPDGFDTLVFPDFTFRIPASRGAYRDRLVAMFPSERRGIDRYVALLEQVEQIGKKFEQTGGKPTLRLALDVALHGRLLARYQNATIAQVLDDCTRDPRLRAVILGQNGDYGLPPSEVSALLHCGLANHYFTGAVYPVGGGQVIADALAGVIEASGGTVHLRHGVSGIVVRDGRAAGVRVETRDGLHEVAAQWVLSNADLKRTVAELLPAEAVPAAWADKIRGYRMAGALFMTCLGVEGDLRAYGMQNSNYWQFDGHDTEAMYRAGRRADAAVAAGCYVTSASVKDPETTHHAPAGYSTVEVMTLVPADAAMWGVVEQAPGTWSYKESPAYQATKQRLEDDMVRRFAMLFPAAAERIVLRESATPLTHTRYTRASGGTAYGIAATPDQFMQKRPGYRTPIDRLLLCGASTRAGHGVVGAMMSGRNAASTLLKLEG